MRGSCFLFCRLRLLSFSTMSSLVTATTEQTMASSLSLAETAMLDIADHVNRIRNACAADVATAQSGRNHPSGRP